jgi:hypothetical protein
LCFLYLQAQQWKYVLQEALKASAIAVLLEFFLLSSNLQWWEEYLDFASVQAALFDNHATTLWQQMKVLVRHQARVST